MAAVIIFFFFFFFFGGFWKEGLVFRALSAQKLVLTWYNLVYSAFFNSLLRLLSISHALRWAAVMT